MTRVHAFGDDALGDLDAVGLVEALHAGKVSVREVVDASIARVQQVDPQLNGMAFTAYDRARAEARDPRGGYFAGVPTLVKDNVDVAGMPTMQGADSWVGHPAKKDGDFARMFLATGLIPLGKSQLSEYGYSAAAEHPRLGAVRTPWNTDHIAGASSSGSAALVAAGAVPVAHANDGGGSIRIPASVNGLVGLKPTRDRLAQDKMMRDQPIRIVSDGMVSRSVRDTAAFFREAEKVYRALALPPVGDITRPGRKRLRIGVHTAGVGRGADPDVTDLTMKTARLLEEMGHTVVEADAPVSETFPDDFLLYWAMTAMFLIRTGRRAHGRTFDKSRHDNLTLGLVAHAQRNLHRIPGAIRRLKRLQAQRRPTTSGTTSPSRRRSLTRPRGSATSIRRRTTTPSWRGCSTGWPSLRSRTSPVIRRSRFRWRRQPVGCRMGMMFAAGAGREALLLELAFELEEAAPFAKITAP